MCCFVSLLLLFGPRITLLFWWLFRPSYFQVVFPSWIWLVLGVIFAPWTALMFAIVGAGGVAGWDWLWLALALLADLGSYSGSAYGNRDRIPGYRSV